MFCMFIVRHIDGVMVCGGVMVWTLDLQSRGHGFISWPLHCHNSSSRGYITFITKQYKLVPGTNSGDALQQGW